MVALATGGGGWHVLSWYAVEKTPEVKLCSSVGVHVIQHLNLNKAQIFDY